MKTEKAIKEFKRRVVDPLIADLTRTLEVTCKKSGEENHGSNFIGNAVVLIGVETVAQFINPKSKEELENFRKVAREEHKKLSTEQKHFLDRKYAPAEALGSRLAQKFMKSFFHARFKRKETRLKINLTELIWAFRNPHSHSFYPYSKRKFGSTEVNGDVMWLYKDKHKTGISIKEVEENFLKYNKALYKVKGTWFSLCPQVLLVYFIKAINDFIRRILRDKELARVFLENYRRLAPVYRFQP